MHIVKCVKCTHLVCKQMVACVDSHRITTTQVGIPYLPSSSVFIQLYPVLSNHDSDVYCYRFVFLSLDLYKWNQAVYILLSLASMRFMSLHVAFFF